MAAAGCYDLEEYLYTAQGQAVFDLAPDQIEFVVGAACGVSVRIPHVQAHRK